MSNEAIGGMAASQESGRKEATTSRNTHKIWHKKGILYIIGACIFFILLGQWRTYQIEREQNPKEAVVEKMNVEAPKSAQLTTTVSDGTGRKVFQVTPTEFSTPTRVVKGRCFEAWVEDSKLPEHRTQVSTLAKPTEWKDIESAADMPIAWVRHGSKGPGATKVTEEIRRDGNCS